MKYAFIQKHRDEFPIKAMCRVLEVSVSGFYDSRGRDDSPRAKVQVKLASKIAEIHASSRGTYGSPRIHRVLTGRGEPISVSKVARVMRKYNIRSKTKRRFKVTTNSNHKLPIAPNLRNDASMPTAQKQILVGDITYVATKEGWLYVATAMDLYSREIVGCAMSDRMTAEIVCSALKMAVTHGKSQPGAIFHSDQGSQYASHRFRQLLSFYKMRQSMSRRGCCWDNAEMESFFHTLKTEFVYHEVFESRDEAKRRIFEWIQVFYNRTRIHSGIGYVTPASLNVDQAAKAA